MGTNYYLHEKPDCKCCGRPFEPKHIGKSSGGWCFALRVYPDDSINTLDDWRELWGKPGAFIRNEYDEVIPIEDMELIITVRHGKDRTDAGWRGYNSEADFHRRNSSQPGPNNLVRHAIDGRWCVGHGPGTWDYINCEFS
jgi:hypothetical protein